MAAEVLRGRMEHEVDAEFQRPLIERCGKSRIDHRLYPMPAADVGESFEIDDAVVRIGWRLTYQYAGRGTQRLFDGLVVARRSHRDFDSITMQRLAEKLPRAPV